MPNKKTGVTRESIIKTALQLIDENRGVRNVTLREIAKTMGCAHTNLYNYFGSLDEILWASLGQVLLNQIEIELAEFDVIEDKDRNVHSILKQIVYFWTDHPGWYRLVWMEQIHGRPPEEIMEIIRKPGTIFANEVVKANDGRISEKKAVAVSRILHSYLNSEISRLITGKSFLGDEAQVKNTIYETSKALYKLLVQNPEVIPSDNIVKSE